MNKCNVFNVKLPNSKLNKLKFGIKNNIDITWNLSSNTIGNSNDETNFPHKLLLTNTQASRLCKVFANNWSGNLKLSKSQNEIGQSRGFLVTLLRPLLKFSFLVYLNH